MCVLHTIHRNSAFFDPEIWVLDIIVLMRSPLFLLLLLCASCGPTGISVSSAETGATSSTASTAEAETGSDDSSSSSSSSSSSTGSTDTTDTSTTTDSFVPLVDADPTPNCDPFTQDCPDGEKCVPYASSGGAWDANKCVAVMGEQAPGEPCVYGGLTESTDDCDATSFCWNVEEVDGEMLGTCHGFCEGTADMPECPEGYHCPISSDGPINLCFQTCDPIAQDCQDGLGCYWDNRAFACIFTQEPGIADGQPCGYINDCLPGSFCVDGAVVPACNGSACCVPFCDLGLGDAQCAGVPGTFCVPFWEQGLAPAGFEQVGVCVFEP